jgi:epoxyqueuosine reductase
MRDLTGRIKLLASQTGFACVGIAPAGPVPHAESLQTWLDRGWHADMRYMARNLPERLRPDLLCPDARSVICLAVSYAPSAGASAPPGDVLPFVAAYARGRDYHKVLKRRCMRLMDRIRELGPGFEGRAFVDTAPVMERSLAVLAGLGWIGRNGCLVVPGLGSYVVLCEVVCNLPLQVDSPLPSGCLDCRACVQACPTGAIHDGALLDARRCLSYLTVEHRGSIDPQYRPCAGLRVFGCDTCQEVCPHNRDVPAGDPELAPGRLPLNGARLADVLAWTDGDWDAATRGSAARRATCEMFLRNAAQAAGNSGDASLIRLLERLRGRSDGLDPVVDWAIRRLSQDTSSGMERDCRD